ncbi:unnamed protein product [Heterobilharzia americana]|nr:unnamed protein product [Heterobilharzia americana]
MFNVAQTQRSTGENLVVRRGGARQRMKTGLLSGECREDGGDEDTQPTNQPPPAATTITLCTNHHQRRNVVEVVSFTYTCLGKAASFQLQAVAQAQMRRQSQDRNSKQDRPSCINLKSVWRSTALHSA